MVRKQLQYYLKRTNQQIIAANNPEHWISAPCLDPQRQTFSFLYLSKVEEKKNTKKNHSYQEPCRKRKGKPSWQMTTQGKRKSNFFRFGLLTHRFHPMQNFREKIKDISFKGLKKCNFCLQLRLQKIVATGTSKSSSSCRYLTGCYDNQVTNWRMGRDRNLKLTSSSFTYFKE